MSSIISILDDTQHKEFDSPPKLSYPQKGIIFSLPDWAEIEIKKMKTHTNKIGFILQLGYFKVTGRFFNVETFQKEDFLFIIQNNLLRNSKFNAFKKAYCFSLYPHRHIILENFGVLSFKDYQKDNLYQEATRLLRKQVHPQGVFYTLASFLRTNQIEIPAYSTLASILTQAIRKRDTELMKIIKQNLTPQIEDIFEKMLSIKQDSQEKRYLLTQLRNNKELMKPQAIKSNIKDYRILKKYYEQTKTLLPLLDISDEMIRYYAQFVLRSQVFQLTRRENKYLMLLCFIVYQYRFLGDLLLHTFLRATQQFENTTQRACKEAIYERYLDNQNSLQELFTLNEQMIDELNTLESITLDSTITNQKKFEYLINWTLSDVFWKFKNNKSNLFKLKKRGYIKKDDVYYQVLEEKSRVLQYRVSDILRHLDFDSKNEYLKIALENFKQKDGNITPEKFTDGFLKKHEKEILKKSKSPISLYKVMLAQSVASHIKSGQIALKESFEYQTFENYLIDENTWKSSKHELLKKFHLDWMKDWKSIEIQLKKRILDAYRTTFLQIKQNPFGQKRKNKKSQFLDPAPPESQVFLDLFPKEGSISIVEVLTTIEQKVNFTACFQHFSIRNQTTRPNHALFFATILAYGCNIGLGVMARNSPNISAHSLENVANWYFSLENLQRANDKIIALLDQLKVGELFRKSPSVIHTSSDGQKILVQTDSIHANYSYKYFGKDKGIVIYAFIDEMHRLFHSSTISSQEREALYVLDGLLQNQIVQSNLHSTDTHGTNGINFALLYLSGIRFIPRIENFQKQYIYCFEDTKVPELDGYEVKLGRILKPDVIEQNWDMVCRLMVSILSKHCSASTIIKRLGSYERQHPVMQALRELDKILKTEYMLQYTNDTNLRQIIQKQLNKSENANKFSRAVVWGNNGNIKFSSKEEQLLVDVCKRLIQNAIIAWNYLYITQQVFKTNPIERESLIQHIKESSPVRWKHVNLHGTFDFSQEALQNAINFDMEELINFDWNI
ncbi:MAG: Tn3 family transposase [Raineya sp.]|jgi:TnpA family transposase|nr:Tn3 family transposase [Raineya sp.]